MATGQMCYLTYSAAVPSQAAVARAIEDRRAALPDGLRVDLGESLLVSTPQTSIFFMFIDAPFPAGDLGKDPEQRMVWPACAAESRAWRSHLIVLTMGGGTDLVARRTAAADQLRVAAAIAEGTGASAVAWGGAMVFHPAQAFAAAIARDPLAPDVLVRGRWYGDGWSRAGLRTEGLAAFDLPEIDHPPTGEPAHEIANRVLNIAAYLMAQGMVLKDGDTLGPTEAPALRVHHAHTPDGALQLRLESLTT